MNMDWANLLHTNYEKEVAKCAMDTDLNLTGLKSIHHLIDFTVSMEGSELLRDWLLTEKPDLNTLHTRQRKVQELLSDQRFRERFLLAYYKSNEKRLHGNNLIAWLKTGIVNPNMKWHLLLSLTLCSSGWIFFIFFATGRISSIYWLICIALYFTVHIWKIYKIQIAMNDIQMLDDELTKIKPVLRFLEKYDYRNLPEIKRMCHPFLAVRPYPTKYLKTIKLYAAAIGLRMNPAMAIFLNIVMPWDLLFTYLIELEKKQLKSKIPIWMNSFYQIEALISLANFAYVNPHYTFPELLAIDPYAKVFSVQAMGHPLIPDDKKVRNNFSFETLGKVSIVTGSNMTGKSTFLKTVGINLRIAYAGGPVDAQRMSSNLFRLMTSIRISDSLAEEMSYFYVEVKRLKQILMALEEKSNQPIFFLIDEIFKGTNNAERYLGSKSYIKAISGKHGVGLVTTHDLKLNALGNHCSIISNQHFGDSINNGKLVFDYKLKHGPCTSTNALEILKNEGLPIDA